MSQSTTVLANRLTQVALYPQEYTYVKLRVEANFNQIIQLKPHCGMRKLDFFKQYTTEECHVECSYKAVMDKCKCWPPYFPASVLLVVSKIFFHQMKSQTSKRKAF